MVGCDVLTGSTRELTVKDCIAPLSGVLSWESHKGYGLHDRGAGWNTINATTLKRKGVRYGFASD
jgi:hypothetical protein